MSTRDQEAKAKRTLTSTVKENPLASVAIAAISSALVTFLSQTYATTSYVQKQRVDIIDYVDGKTKNLDDRIQTNTNALTRYEGKLDTMSDKLDDIKEKLYSIKR